LWEAIHRVEAGEGDPVLWALLQTNLGVALAQNPLDNRADNLEQAVAAYEAALIILNRTNFREEWATVHLNLGNAYALRVRGDRADNIERAIAAYEAAFTVNTHDDFPIEWADTQNDLGGSYRDRLLGNPAENIESAITAFKAALTVRTREKYPTEWAESTFNLAGAYIDRLVGNQAKNIEQAITNFEAALTIFTPKDLPVQWAQTQHHLGLAYLRRLVGNRAQNIERAIAALEDALTIRTRAAFPVEWAMTQNNLGDTYRIRIADDRDKNLERAVTILEAALTVRTRDAFPVQHRDTQLNLAFAREAQGRWTEAHAAYTAAREVQRDLLALTPYAESLAATIANRARADMYLGDANALLHMPSPDLVQVAEALEEGRAQGLRTALALDAIDPQQILHSAARVRAEEFVQKRDAWRTAQQELVAPVPVDLDTHQAIILREQRRHAFEQTLAAIERARDAIREHDNPDFLSPAVRLADITSALTAGGFGRDEALVYVAAGQESGFALILRVDQHSDVRPHHMPLPHLTEAAVAALNETHASTVVPIDTNDEAAEVRLVSGGLAQAQMGWAYDNLRTWAASAREALTLLPPTSGFAQALLGLRKEWASHPTLAQGLLALLDTPFAELTDEQKSQLASAFHDALLRFELQRSLRELGKLGMNELVTTLQRQGMRRVALIPYGRLSLFPLPAVMTVDTLHNSHHARMSDLFEVTLAPSAHAYTYARTRAAEADRERAGQASTRTRNRILAIGNPLPLPYGMRSATIYNGNLAFAAAEADGLRRIAQAFGHGRETVVTLIGRMATRAQALAHLSRAWYGHLAMHGQFNTIQPRDSKLILAGDLSVSEVERILTLGECLDGKVPLTGMRLLVLSACETSLIEVRRAANEVIGMASGFLQAGAAAVIASLWPVDDRATFLLMTRFMQLWLDPAHDWSPAKALAEAQRWLQEEATNAVIAAYDPNRAATEPTRPSPSTDSEHSNFASQEEYALAGTRSLRYTQSTALDQLRIIAMRHDEPDHLPYADPIYWAAFTVTGA
jgi:CHAT domain-containing protein